MLTVRRGFTLVELLVALAMLGVFAGSVSRLLVHMQRQYLHQVERAELRATLQTAAGLLVQELRELDATDPAGSDLLEPGDSSIIYRAMRGLYTTCASSLGAVIYLDTTLMGLRGVEVEYDSVLILTRSAPPFLDGDRWAHGDVAYVSSGYDCPGNRPSLRLGVRLSSPAESVLAGSPVRVFEVAQWRSYRDEAGDTWLGRRRHHKSNGWNVVQPVAGPLERRGLRFTYLAEDGNAADPAGPGLSRIALTLVGRSAQAVRASNTRLGYLVDSMATEVSLRNNRR